MRDRVKVYPEPVMPDRGSFQKYDHRDLTQKGPQILSLVNGKMEGMQEKVST